LWLDISEESDARIIAHSHCKSITWFHEMLGTDCNSSAEVRNYKVFIIDL